MQQVSFYFFCSASRQVPALRSQARACRKSLPQGVPQRPHCYKGHVQLTLKKAMTLLSKKRSLPPLRPTHPHPHVHTHIHTHLHTRTHTHVHTHIHHTTHITYFFIKKRKTHAGDTAASKVLKYASTRLHFLKVNKSRT